MRAELIYASAVTIAAFALLSRGTSGLRWSVWRFRAFLLNATATHTYTDAFFAPKQMGTFESAALKMGPVVTKAAEKLDHATSAGMDKMYHAGAKVTDTAGAAKETAAAAAERAKRATEGAAKAAAGSATHAKEGVLSAAERAKEATLGAARAAWDKVAHAGEEAVDEAAAKAAAKAAGS